MKLILSLVSLTIVGAWAWRFWSLFNAPMGWGMMDDPTWLESFRAIHASAHWPGLLQWTWDTAITDITGGLFRPTYALWAWFVYDFLAFQKNLSPAWIYSLCFGIHIFTSLLFGLIFVRSHNKPNYTYFIVYILLFWSFTPSLNLVGLISLQERLALLLSGLALLTLWWQPRWLWPLSYLLWLGALGAKATAVVFVIPLVIALADHGIRANLFRIGFFAMTALNWGLFAGWIARKGLYTQSRYVVSSEMLMNYLRQGGPWAWAVALIAGTALMMEVLRMMKDRVQTQTWNFSPLLWPLTTAALLALMLPWGIQGYYWSIFTPAVAGCAALIFLRINSLLDLNGQRVALLVLLVPFSISLGPKMGKLIDRSTSTKLVVEWLQSAEASPIETVFMPMPCIEAIHSLALLSHRPVNSIQVWEQTPPERRIFNDKTALLTWWECPLIPAEIAPTPQLKKDWGDWKLFR